MLGLCSDPIFAHLTPPTQLLIDAHLLAHKNAIDESLSEETFGGAVSEQ